MMPQLLLVFTSGLLGSAHCVGMCGPFAALLGMHTPGRMENLTRQCIYSLGRITTYAFLGCCVGFGGRQLIEWAPRGVSISALLSLFAGGFLMLEGLKQLGLLRWSVRQGPQNGCLGVSVLRTLLTSRGLAASFLAGIATGFLPCGLVYAFLALALQSGSMFGGLLTMTCFGLGTVPIMVATGWSASLLSVSVRQRLFRLAALSILLVGCWTLYRGTLFLASPSQSANAPCPFCTDE